MESAADRSTGDRQGLRPSERRAAARTAVVWDAVQALLGDDDPAVGSATVVDVGGGTGGFAVRLAEQGHDVIVIDPSPDALAALARRAEERGVADRVTARQGDLDDLAALTPSEVDLVLCHGVLGVVPDPAAALDSISAVLRPGGALSLLVSGRQAAVLARAMAGQFDHARDLLDDTRPGDPTGRGSERRFTAAEVIELLSAAGLAAADAGVRGVRVFTDLVPSALLDEPGGFSALLALERAVADRPDYLGLATQLHALATRA